MLRRAVIQHLKVQVPALGGRVYQAFLAPPGTTRPYATVKLPGIRGSPAISYAGAQQVEIRIYGDRDTFTALDQIEADVIGALHGIEVLDATDGSQHQVDWLPGGGDFPDDDKGLIGRLVMFEAAVLFERG
ncbi:hypothetical protein [Geobacter sp.]|uniref:hypothetical protein n=1 Tax=Geobacter sp. TaxID=46610 RepID=UPI00262A2CE3|nr:hypothetical protein [Geobacter sp.]